MRGMCISSPQVGTYPELGAQGGHAPCTPKPVSNLSIPPVSCLPCPDCPELRWLLFLYPLHHPVLVTGYWLTPLMNLEPQGQDLKFGFTTITPQT